MRGSTMKSLHVSTVGVAILVYFQVALSSCLLLGTPREINKWLSKNVESTDAKVLMDSVKRHLQSQGEMMKPEVAEAWRQLVDVISVLEPEKRCTDASIGLIEKVTTNMQYTRGTKPAKPLHVILSYVSYQHAATCFQIYREEYRRKLIESNLVDTTRLLFNLVVGTFCSLMVSTSWYEPEKEELKKLFKFLRKCSYKEAAKSWMLGVYKFHDDKRLVDALEPRMCHSQVGGVANRPDGEAYGGFVRSSYESCSSYLRQVGELMQRVSRDSVASDYLPAAGPKKCVDGVPKLRHGWLVAKFCEEFVASHPDQEQLSHQMMAYRMHPDFYV